MDSWIKYGACVALGVLFGVCGMVGAQTWFSPDPISSPGAFSKEVSVPVQNTMPKERAAPKNRGEENQGQQQLAACLKQVAMLKHKLQSLQTQAVDQGDMIEDLEDTLVKSGAQSRWGTPLGWPEGITPEGNAKALDTFMERLRKECPSYAQGNVQTDCDEFPCMAFVKSQESLSDRGKQHFKSCKLFREMVDGQGTLTSMPLEQANGEKTNLWAFQPNPADTDERVIKYLEEYQDNRNKRFGRRIGKAATREMVKKYIPDCEAGDAKACLQMGTSLYWSGDKEEGFTHIRNSCDNNLGSACNTMAWNLCKEEKRCGDEALGFAQKAAKLNPEDGRGALDTLGYILCRTGRTSEADAAFVRSCNAGYQRNCNRKCSP